MTGDDPALQPGEAWTPAAARAFIRRHDRDVAAAFMRLTDEMAAAFPRGTLHPFRYTARTLLRYHTRHAGLDAQPLAHVQVRTADGAVHAAVIAVVWETGEVVVRGWPHDEGSGWFVPG